ncbi:hypothetical protein ACHAPC_000273 [Botrytis cinerea]
MSKNNQDNLSPAFKPALFDPRKKEAQQQPPLSQMLTQMQAAKRDPATQPFADTAMANFSTPASGEEASQGMAPTQPAAEMGMAVSFGADGPEFGAGVPTFGAGMPAFGSGVPAFGTGMPEFGSGVPAFGTGMPEFGSGVPAFGTGMPEFGSGVPAFGTGMPEFDSGVPAFDTGIPEFGSGVPAFGAGTHNSVNVSGDAEPESNSSFKFSISHMVPKSIENATLKQENTDLRLQLNAAREKIAAQQSGYEKMETELSETKILAFQSGWYKQQHDSIKDENEDLEASNAGFQEEVSRLNKELEIAKTRMLSLETDLAITNFMRQTLEKEARDRGFAPGFGNQPLQSMVQEKEDQISDLRGRIGRMEDELENAKNQHSAEFDRLNGNITKLQTELGHANQRNVDSDIILNRYRDQYSECESLRLKSESKLQVALTDKTTTENLASQYHSTILQLHETLQEVQFKQTQEKHDAEDIVNKHIGEKQQIQQHLNQLQHEYQNLKLHAEKEASDLNATVANAAKAMKERDAAVSVADKLEKERDDAFIVAENLRSERDAAFSFANKVMERRDSAVTEDLKERHTTGITAKQLDREEPQGPEPSAQQLKDDVKQSRQQLLKLTTEKSQLVGAKSNHSIFEQSDTRTIRKLRIERDSLELLYKTLKENLTNPTSVEAVEKVKQLETEFLKSQKAVRCLEGEVRFIEDYSSRASQKLKDNISSLQSKISELESSLSECTSIKDKTAIALSECQGKIESDQEIKRSYQDQLSKKTEEVERVAAALQKLQEEQSILVATTVQNLDSETSAHKKTSAELHSLKEEFKKQKSELRLTKKVFRELKLAPLSSDNTAPGSPSLGPVLGNSGMGQNSISKKTDREAIINLLSESDEGLIAATRKGFHERQEKIKKAKIEQEKIELEKIELEKIEQEKIELEKIKQPIPNNEIPITEDPAEIVSSETPKISVPVPESTGNSFPAQDSTTIDEYIPLRMAVQSPASSTLELAPEFVDENFLTMKCPEITEQTPIPVIVVESKFSPRSKAYSWSRFFFIAFLTICWVGHMWPSTTLFTPGVIHLIDAPKPASIPVATMNVPTFAIPTTFRLAVIPEIATETASVQIPQVTTVAVLPRYADFLPQILYPSRIIHLHQLFKVKSVVFWDVFKTSVRRFARNFSPRH